MGCQAIPGTGEFDLKLKYPRAYKKTPAPPRKSTKILEMYLPLNSDPATSQPSDILGNKNIKGLNPKVKPVQGCPPLADGSQNNYCWTINVRDKSIYALINN